MRRAVAAAGIALFALAGCGAPEELSDEDGRKLALTREHLDDAIDTTETLRTSEPEARRLRRQVQEIVADGSFEAARLDEFGIAKLGELREVVPSLVLTDEEDSVRALDRRATAQLLRFAEREHSRALLGPARREVDGMVRTLEAGDAGKDTKIPVVDQTAEAYLREAERDVRPIWPSLGRRLAGAREDL